jgi:hypothetical protein
VHERGYWDAYQKAISEMLTYTSTEWAPWYVIPADRKWFARIGVAATLVDTLVRIDPQFPKLDEERLAGLQAAREQLEAEAPPSAS